MDVAATGNDFSTLIFDATMIIAHYEHRLPHDYDLDAIRKRAAQRGSLWNDVPDLCFKVFLLREAGQHGAIAHSYSSLYLWEQDAAFQRFITDGRFRTVTGSFGRPRIQTRFALDARKGQASAARFAYKQEVAVPVDVDPAEFFAAEIRRNQEAVTQPGMVAAAVGADVQEWKVTRVLLSEHALAAGSEVAAYQVLYLAQPGLHALPC